MHCYTIHTIFCPDVISGLNQLYTELVEVLECVIPETIWSCEGYKLQVRLKLIIIFYSSDYNKVR